MNYPAKFTYTGGQFLFINQTTGSICLGGPKWQDLNPKCAQIRLLSHYQPLMMALSKYGIVKEPGTHT